jgi:4-amino-4-deoxy-L-arabinose transferase-like glycosyltransferase
MMNASMENGKKTPGKLSASAPRGDRDCRFQFRHDAFSALVLLIICLLWWLPGFFSVPPIDRDEARWAQTSRQILEQDEWWQLRFQQEWRMKKPPGEYWLQAAATRVFSEPDSAGIWPYRLPSLLGGLVAVLGLYLFGIPLFGRRCAFGAAVLLASCFLLGIQVRMAKADAPLLATAVFCLVSLAQVYRVALKDRLSDRCAPPAGSLEITDKDGSPSSTLAVALFWISLAAAGLLKGPFLPFIAALTVIVLLAADGSLKLWHALHPWWGIPLLLVATAAWFIPMELAGPVGYGEAGLAQDLLLKMLTGVESHFFPPGFYLASFWLFFFPGSLVAGVAVWQAWKERNRPVLRVCLAWLVPSWLFLELMPTKLPHYVLPLYPAVTVLTAWILTVPESVGREAWRPRWVAMGRGCWMLIPLSLGLALPMAAWYLGAPFDWIDLAFPLLLLSGAAVSVWRIGRGVPRMRMMLPVLTVWCAFSAWVWQQSLPRWDSLWLSRGIVQAALMNSPDSLKPPRMAAAGYHEPSLVFMAGSTTLLLEPEGVAEALAKKTVSLGVVSESLRDRFLRQCSDVGIHVRELDRVRGLNYTKWEWITLMLFAEEARP